MDPTTTATMLGQGGAQVVLAVVVVALALVAWKLASTLIETQNKRVEESQLWGTKYSDRLAEMTTTARELANLINAALSRLK